MKNILSPSILAADYWNLGRDIKAVEEAGAEYLHIDVMDGMFVPALSIGMCVQESIRKSTDMIFDTHLMVTDPERYVKEFARLGSRIITVHQEACKNPGEVLEEIRSLGCMAGLSIKPDTPVEVLEPYMDMMDLILIMSVEPGFGGQKYIESSTGKIADTRRLIDRTGRDILLEVDGGIGLSNVGMVLDAGANVIVAGSAIFKNPSNNTREFMKILKEKER